ncbi:MAG: LysR family transcriptional regulator, low CO2-responsive transcriptional regulator [Pyrinomonadaceae bacterium]|jgi:DNA-binding transcriptional LysR family regulator|nr:LysR family transcriptional regulator, low CO2-responsive transcriptional regulator [Pyrinomonadaceae bacterium]
MEMSQLRAFRVVAETLNFTRAAERLNLTQAAVSHQIKALETELGEPLFIRLKRGVKLSQAGEAALEYAERILDDAEALRERVSGAECALVGRVRAAAATQAFVHLFASLFESFMRANPHIELSFRTTVSTEQTLSDVLTGATDVGFASLPIYSPALEVTELFEDELVLVVGRAHRLARVEGAVTVREIERERLIMFERGTSIRRTTEDFFKRAAIRPALALESNDTYFMKRMVEQGLGISLLPSWAVREEVETGKLAQLEIEGHRLRRTVAMISLARFQPAPARLFLAFMLRHKTRLQEMAATGEPATTTAAVVAVEETA